MQRAYALHLPEGPAPATLVVMLHGCIQPAEQFVVATRMNDAAAAKGWAVLWPAQSVKANDLRCWNWYLPEHQRRAEGEPAMLADIVREVRERYAIDETFLCGISAGAAMSAILAATYPELFDAVAMHSGVPYGVAANMNTALAVMRDATGDPVALGKLVHGTMKKAMPVLVLHGGQDAALGARNGTNLAQQWAVANRLARGGEASVPATSEAPHREEGRYDATVVTYDGADVEEWRIPELDHAWSGGAAEATYTDPKGPDATAAVLAFFSRFSRL
jgi:poly(hydroxyalkanoate) depolymerase family esterase